MKHKVFAVIHLKYGEIKLSGLYNLENQERLLDRVEAKYGPQNIKQCVLWYKPPYKHNLNGFTSKLQTI